MAIEFDVTTCPFCGSDNIDGLDWFHDSEKKICRDCGNDYVIWFYDDEHEVVEDVTDRNGRSLVQ